MRFFYFILFLGCFVVGISFPFYGFDSLTPYFYAIGAFLTIKTWYHKTKKSGKWNPSTTHIEIVTYGLVVIIFGYALVWWVMKETAPGPMYPIGNNTYSNVDPNIEKNRLKEVEQLKENNTFLGIWAPADSCIRKVTYRSKSNVLIYKMKKPSNFVTFFMIHETTPWGKNILENGMSSRDGAIVIFGLDHFFDTKSLAFLDNSYVKISGP